MTRLPDFVKSEIESALGHLQAVQHVSGGCIANAVRADCANGRAFLKWGASDVATSFAAEAEGLRALAGADSSLVIPAVIATGTDPQGVGYLAMEWLETGRASDAFWNALGHGLAELHDATADAFGFEGDNFIGRITQSNRWCDSWIDFFMGHRLQPQVERARARGVWEPQWDSSFDRLATVIEEVVANAVRPSLLHGDLWSGNIVPLSDGRAAIIDPAVYYGHDDAELAYTELFGGFSAVFYRRYRSVRPVATGYERRRDLYNLYHLINHLNHFGSAYSGQVGRTLSRLVG